MQMSMVVQSEAEECHINKWKGKVRGLYEYDFLPVREAMDCDP